MAGFILWEGASKRDAKPIVAIATGFGRKSANAKTGSMIQTWILRARVDPVRAIYNGADGSICGACKLRGNGRGRGRTCYVRVNHAPYAIYHAYRRGGYPKVSLARAAELCAGRKVRLGAYGDPAVVPIGVWHAILKRAAGWTGYTHQWRERFCAASLNRYVMASTETMPRQRPHASSVGARSGSGVPMNRCGRTKSFALRAQKPAGSVRAKPV